MGASVRDAPRAELLVEIGAGDDVARAGGSGAPVPRATTAISWTPGSARRLRRSGRWCGGGPAESVRAPEPRRDANRQPLERELRLGQGRAGGSRTERLEEGEAEQREDVGAGHEAPLQNA